MTYDVFLEQMKNDLQTAFSREMPEKYSQVKIGIRDVEKLQGESYRGISFRIGDSPIEGNLNLQQAYQEQEAGIPYSEILRKTKEAIKQQVYRMPQFNLGELSSYEAVKQSMMMELIPQKGNEERLAEIPHRDVEDMALIYRMDMGEGSNGRMTAVITNQNLTAYGITAEQMHQDALANAPESHPASLRSLRDVMAGMMGMETDPVMPGEPVIMVATTRDSFLEASVIQYPGFMEQAAEQIGGELTGLRWCDIDLDEGLIDVNHTLVYYKHEVNGCYFSVNTPNTEAGRRTVPMLEFVKEAFMEEKRYQEENGIVCVSKVDGYTDFIFVNRFGMVQHQATLNKAIRRITRDCNDAELLNNPNTEILLPHFSCHSLRHTFTTRMCEAGVNVKVIHDTLGHADISTTLNIYADVTKDLEKSEFEGLDNWFNGSMNRKKADEDSKDESEVSSV